MVVVDANMNIKMTRGDSAELTVALTTAGGESYDFSDDTVKFGVKQSAWERDLMLEKTVDSSTGKFVIEPEDTANMPFGDYLFDVRVYHTDSEEKTSISTPISGNFSLLYNVLPSVAPESNEDSEEESNVEDNVEDNEEENNN